MKKTVTNLLLDWHINSNKREMPWKGERDPYKIWLSEIILQQTRVEQGMAYYEKFIINYPTIQDLASAKDEDIFKLWEGLGYYNRCKNLLYTARSIVEQKGGKFPLEYEDILELKGIGPYTAAAIASFAFNKPFAVLDGNVYRVLARLFAIDTPIDTSAGKKQFAALAQLILDKKYPALYNQAIMDFGATVCMPANPNCSACKLQIICEGYKKGIVNRLPIKEKVLLKKNRWLYYFIIQFGNKVLVEKRILKDIWDNLFEFYLLESNEQLTLDKSSVQAFFYQHLGINNIEVVSISSVQKQQLTHQQIRGQFICVNISYIPENLKHHKWLSAEEIHKLAFPRYINQYLESNPIFNKHSYTQTK